MNDPLNLSKRDKDEAFIVAINLLKKNVKPLMATIQGASLVEATNAYVLELLNSMIYKRLVSISDAKILLAAMMMVGMANRLQAGSTIEELDDLDI